MIVKEKNREGFLDLRICDNLELMAEIKDNTIDLIYCDILYGTGRKFADYQDLKPIRSEIESHYIPRIKEMYRILKPTGSIYLQMDSRISHWVRCIMDGVFSYGNFRNELVWCYKSGGSSDNGFAKKHDTILFYSKSKIYTFNPQKEKSYMKPTSGKNPRQKYYSDKDGVYTLVNAKDWWIDIGMLSTDAKERTGYYSQKPKELIERIIKSGSNEGDLVADFYLGSGTTAVVCKEQNRKFIGCDINPKAIEITKARLDALS